MGDDETERRTGYGELKSDVKNVVKTVERIEAILVRNDENYREDKKELWKSIGEVRQSVADAHQKIATGRGVALTLQTVWAAAVAWFASRFSGGAGGQ